MQKGSDLIGKQVVFFETGEKKHKVQDLIFDPSTNTILGLVVDTGGWFSNARVLPLEYVQSIGEDAVIIQNETGIINAEDDPKIAQIMSAKNVLKGTRVMSEDGKDLGKLVDVYFDESSGKVTHFEVSGGILADTYNGRSFIPADEALKVGEDVVFVSAAAAQAAMDKIGGLRATAQEAKESVQEYAQQTEEKYQEKYLPEYEDAKVEAQGTATQVKEEVKESFQEVKEKAGQAWDQLKDKTSEWQEKASREVETSRIEQALGRPVNRVILDPNDQVILDVGQLITNRAIQDAREAGVLDMLLNSVYFGQTASFNQQSERRPSGPTVKHYVPNRNSANQQQRVGK